MSMTEEKIEKKAPAKKVATKKVSTKEVAEKKRPLRRSGLSSMQEVAMKQK